MNERDQFQSQVKAVLKPALVAEGFRGSGPTFRRTQAEVIHVIKLQGSIYGGRCCVCLGIHLTFLPVIGNCDPAKITEPDCEFRSRLTPPGQDDSWWSYGATELEARASAEAILRLYREVGVPYFQQFSKFPDDFIRVTPAMLSSGGPLPFPGQNTKAGRALALSRIALHIGRIADAKQFAEYGLAHVGLGTALKIEFQKILSAE